MDFFSNCIFRHCLLKLDVYKELKCYDEKVFAEFYIAEKKGQNILKLTFFYSPQNVFYFFIKLENENTKDSVVICPYYLLYIYYIFIREKFVLHQKVHRENFTTLFCLASVNFGGHFYAKSLNPTTNPTL